MKPDAAQSERRSRRQWQPERGSGGHSVRQQAFAAGLVDAWPRAVGQRNPQALAPRGDCRRQSDGSSADYKHVHHLQLDQSYWTNH
jgi:hypothetical protein